MNHRVVSVQDRCRGAINGAQRLALVGSPVIQPRIICSGYPPSFFPSSVSALRASRILLCTATEAFDPGRGCSSPPGLPDRWKAADPEAVREYRKRERRDKADTAVMQAARRRILTALDSSPEGMRPTAFKNPSACAENHSNPIFRMLSFWDVRDESFPKCFLLNLTLEGTSIHHEAIYLNHPHHRVLVHADAKRPFRVHRPTYSNRLKPQSLCRLPARNPTTEHAEHME